MTKRDYAIAALAGFLVGVFAIPTLVNLGIKNHLFLILLPLIVPPLFAFGVWLGGFLARWIPFMAQFGKFAAVGFLNTAIDFGILNILSATTGVTAGFIVGGVNIPGFSVAVFNSYFWNKLWVFKNRDEGGVFHDFPSFFAVTVIGLVINSSLIIAVTTYVSPISGFSPNAWLNIAKVLASIISLIWNFIGFKFLVFRNG